MFKQVRYLDGEKEETDDIIRPGPVFVVFQNGDTFEGAYTQTDRGLSRSGKGTYTWKSRAKYEGEYKAGKKHGTGIYSFPSGEVYDGAWVDNVKSGEGVYRYPNGDEFRGTWVGDKRNGKGIFFNARDKIELHAMWKDGHLLRDTVIKKSPPKEDLKQETVDLAEPKRAEVKEEVGENNEETIEENKEEVKLESKENEVVEEKVPEVQEEPAKDLVNEEVNKEEIVEEIKPETKPLTTEENKKDESKEMVTPDTKEEVKEVLDDEIKELTEELNKIEHKDDVKKEEVKEEAAEEVTETKEEVKEIEEEKAAPEAAPVSTPEKQEAPATETASVNPLFVVIAGPPAGGKGTQCKLIADKFGLAHISTGDLLREEKAKNSDLGQKAAQYMNEGKLVPSELVVDILGKRLQEKDAKMGALLDGFPRTEDQAKQLKSMGIEIDSCLLLNVPDDVVIERAVGRRLDPETGAIYHLTFNPPPEDIKTRLEHRKDDTKEKMEERLVTYKQNVTHLKNFYEKVLSNVDGNRKPDDVWNDVKAILEDLEKKKEKEKEE